MAIHPKEETEMKERYALTQEMLSAIDVAKAAINERKKIDTAISNNLQDVKNTKAEYDFAETALAALEAELAMASTQKDAIAAEKVAAQAKKHADGKKADFDRAQRITLALHNRAIAADSEIENQKTIILTEVSIFQNSCFENFELELIEAIQPLIKKLALAAIFSNVFRRSSINEVFNSARLPSPMSMKWLTPIIENGKLNTGDKSADFYTIANEDPELLQLSQELEPIWSIQQTLSSHHNFNPNPPAPYVSRALDYRYPNESKKTVTPTSSSAPAVHAQELNVAGASGAISAEEVEWQQTMAGVTR